MKIPFGWDLIDDHEHHRTYRTKVIGGWLINILIYSSEEWKFNVTFLSDHEHKWEIE